jgi:hypothetical protein
MKVDVLGMSDQAIHVSVTILATNICFNTSIIYGDNICHYNYDFFFGKLTYVLKEEDTNIIRGIPQIYNDNRNIKQQMATG